MLKEGRVNVSTLIRYYTKKTDRGKIDITLRKCGFRALYVFNSNFNDSIPTNTITYSSGVSDDDIKLIAYSLLRVGIDIKAIEPYSKESESNGKTNTIEISGNDSYLETRSWTMRELKKFKKRKTLLYII